MKHAFLCGAAVALLAGVSTAPASILRTGGTGGTSWGATQYVCLGGNPCTPPGARFGIRNNLPGANPVAGNNGFSPVNTGSLAPAPEPATGVIVGAGLLAMGFARRKRG